MITWHVRISVLSAAIYGKQNVCRIISFYCGVLMWNNIIMRHQICTTLLSLCVFLHSDQGMILFFFFPHTNILCKQTVLFRSQYIFKLILNSSSLNNFKWCYLLGFCTIRRRDMLLESFWLVESLFSAGWVINMLVNCFLKEFSKIASVHLYIDGSRANRHGLIATKLKIWFHGFFILISNSMMSAKMLALSNLHLLFKCYLSIPDQSIH